MRVEFKRLDVIIFGIGGMALPSQVVISWQIEPVRSRLDEVRFKVERCQSPAFDTDEITVIEAALPGLPGQLVYETVDVTAKLVNLWRRYFYRVVAEGPDSERVVADIKTWETSPKTYELEIIERHQLLLEFETGTPCFAIIERSADGLPCSCIDPTTYRSTVSDCPSCLNTGRQRPYFQPIKFFADFNPPAQLTQIANFGEMQPGMCDAWWGAFPLVKNRDLLLEAQSGAIWRIVNVRPVQPQRTIIQQVVRLERVNPSDVEYKSPILQVDPTLRRQLVATFEESKKERRF